MRASAKDRDDRHEVFCDASSWVRFLLMENHESSAKFSHEPFEELDTEAREAVSIGDHNRSDSSLQDKLQKGTQSGPLEIEAGADVAEDADGSVGEALRALLDKESLLIESVRDLLAGGHAGVTSGDAGDSAQVTPDGTGVLLMAFPSSGLPAHMFLQDTASLAIEEIFTLQEAARFNKYLTPATARLNDWTMLVLSTLQDLSPSIALPVALSGVYPQMVGIAQHDADAGEALVATTATPFVMNDIDPPLEAFTQPPGARVGSVTLTQAVSLSRSLTIFK